MDDQFRDATKKTDDIIRRQDAIDLLNEQINQCDKALGYLNVVHSKIDKYAVKVEKASLIAYKEQLESIPSAQPEINTDGDTISRQAAIDGFYEMASDMDHICTVSDYVSFLESLPSAQPTLYGYEIEHLAYIARVMQKEGVTAEYAVRTFGDVSRASRMIIEELQEKVEKSLSAMQLSSVEPEIIKCKDCRYTDEYGVCQSSKGLAIQDDDDFCSHAERRGG